MRISYPYETAMAYCGDSRRWPDLIYTADHLFLHASLGKALDLAGIIDDDLRRVVTAAWHNGDDSDELVLCNLIDAAVDEQDRRRHTPLRPRPPSQGGRIRLGEPAYPTADWE